MPEVSTAGLLTAFAGGAVSFLSPCVLPLVPGYVSFVAGRSLAGQARSGARAGPAVRALPLGLCFVLGFSTVFVLLGAGATALGRLVLSYRSEAGIIGGAVILLFGLVTTGVLRLPALQRDLRYHGALAGGGPGGAYLLGLAFAFGWTPCIGPVLGSILAVTTVTAGAGGLVLLAAYSLGLGLPFLLATLFTDRLLGLGRGLGRFGRLFNLAAGGVMIGMGLAMMTGRLSEIGSWLLETWPALGRIG